MLVASDRLMLHLPMRHSICSSPVSMKHLKTDTKGAFFTVLHTTRSAQCAMMVLRPGQTTGESNEHPRSEQWLYVVAGTARHRQQSSSQAREGSLLLIEKGALSNRQYRSSTTVTPGYAPGYRTTQLKERDASGSGPPLGKLNAKPNILPKAGAFPRQRRGAERCHSQQGFRRW